MSLFCVRDATERDIPLILRFIKELAEYEQLLHEVVATEESLKQSLFGDRRYAEVLIAEEQHEDSLLPVGFALYFHNYSTFLGKPGIYLEDLYVSPEFRGKGYGKKLLISLAKRAVERGCGRLEWWVLDWNTPSIEFYKKLGAVPMDEWTVFRVTGETLKSLSDQSL